MLSFNIFGDCVARDILDQMVSVQKLAEVNQYVSFINPISLFTEKCDISFSLDELSWGSNFARRNLQFDIDKTAVEYLFEKKSDYIILNPLDCRMDLYKKGNMTLSNSNIIIKNPNFIEYLNENGFEKVEFSQFSEQEYITAWEKLINLVLEHYEEDQIILNCHFGVEEYLQGTFQIKKFGKIQLDKVKKYNALSKILFEDIINLHPRIHVLPFTDTIYADTKHKWSLHPLHYNELYYEYCDKAIGIITERERERENQELTLLKNEYNLIFLKNKIRIQERYYEFTLKKMNDYFNYSKILMDPSCKFTQVLKSANIKTVALYGDFKLAEIIKIYLSKNDIEVKYMISNWNNHTCEITYKTNLDCYPDADALMVCDIANEYKIREKYCEIFPNVFVPSDIKLNS